MFFWGDLLSANFLKIALFFFENWVFFSEFAVLSLMFEDCLFLMLLKHYNIGVSAFLGGFSFQSEERARKMTTGILGFGFFGIKKWPFRQRELFFKNSVAETPISYCIFKGARFLGQVVKQGNSSNENSENRKL